MAEKRKRGSPHPRVNEPVVSDQERAEWDRTSYKRVRPDIERDGNGRIKTLDPRTGEYKYLELLDPQFYPERKKRPR